MEKIPTSMHHMTIKTTTVNSHIRKAVDNYRKAIPKAREMRKEQIREWVEAASKQGNKTMAQHMRATANAEHTKDTFRLLQNVIKPQDQSGIRRLKVPTTNNNGETIRGQQGQEQWTTLTDLQEIESKIIERNIKHFGQATNTPFNSKEFTDIFGIDGDSEATAELLRGKLPNIDSLPTEVQQILQEIAKSLQPIIDTTISTEDLISLFKHWKEPTSTSPSGCHLGHWHALTAPDGLTPDPDSTEDPVGEQIMRIHANKLNTATQRGIPLERWTQVDSTMINKIDGHPRIDK